MTEYDETLEIGLAAGLDVPTAMVISEEPREPKNKSKASYAVAVIAVLIALLIYLLF